MHYLLFIIWILLIISVIFLENKNPAEAVFWVVVIVCLPYAGVVIYLLFGNTVSIKLSNLVRKRRFTSQWRKIAYDSLRFYQSEPSAELSNLDAKVIRFNRSYNDCRLTSCDEHVFYTNGLSHYRQLFEDIENAQDSIHIMFYTIHNDAAGKAFVSLLAKKAREGVKVWLMFDFLANLGSPPSMFHELAKSGGIVKRLKPLIHHFRSHRKIVVIDSKIGYIGGMNIGDKYAGRDKIKHPWRDTQLRLTGECICQLEEYFLKDWITALSKRQCVNISPELMKIPLKLRKGSGSPCQFIAGGVDNDKQSIKMAYLSMIRCAEKSIKIQTPYFIPDRTILETLQTVCAAGVEVEIMIPNIKSSFFLDPVTRYYCGEMLKVGARVYKYHGYIHAKTMSVDNELCCVGSVNLDMRSLCIDDEICGIFYGEDVVLRHCEIYRQDIKDCAEYTLEMFSARGLGSRFAERVFILAAPLM